MILVVAYSGVFLSGGPGVDALSSEELVRLCQRTLPDDTRAFEQLVMRYKGRVFATTYRLMGNQQEAEDQAQEVFIKVFRNLKTLQDPNLLSAWITRIAINTCMDAIARQQRRPTTVPLAPVGPDGEVEEESRYVDTTIPTPEDEVLRLEVRQCLEKAMVRLDKGAREALILRDIDDYSYQEIAEILSIGLSAVKMRIHRARLSFQNALTKVCPEVTATIAHAHNAVRSKVVQN